MTEISKNSRNHRAETVSNTGGQSGNMQPYPYTGHPSQSHQRESANNSFNINGYNQDHINSPQDNFDVAVKDILPLIHFIKEENQFFKNEKKSLEAQMVNLHKLSQRLLLENQQLRKHHSMRTHDIKKIIDTISINTNQQINDITHQSFLIKQSNHLIVKKIQQKIKSNAQINAKLQEQRKLLQRITFVNINLKQNQRDLEVKNRQLFLRCEKLTNQVEKVDANDGLDDINDLTIQVTSLKSQNRSKLLKAKSLTNSHRQQKPKYEQNHQHLTDQVQQLQIQAKGLRETARSSEQKLNQARNISEESLAKFIVSRRLYQHLKFQQQQKIQQISKLKAQIQQRNKKTKNLIPQLQKIKKQKQTLKELINNKKLSLKKEEQKHREQKVKLQAQLRQESAKMRQNINKVIIKANDEIKSKILPEKQKVAEAIKNNLEQYQVLGQQIQDYEDGIRKLDNPIKQIIRLEYLVKKGK